MTLFHACLYCVNPPWLVTANLDGGWATNSEISNSKVRQTQSSSLSQECEVGTVSKTGAIIGGDWICKYIFQESKASCWWSQDRLCVIRVEETRMEINSLPFPVSVSEDP